MVLRKVIARKIPRRLFNSQFLVTYQLKVMIIPPRVPSNEAILTLPNIGNLISFLRKLSVDGLSPYRIKSSIMIDELPIHESMIKYVNTFLMYSKNINNRNNTALADIKKHIAYDNLISVACSSSSVRFCNC